MEASWLESYQTLLGAFLGALAMLAAKPTFKRLIKAARLRKRGELHETRDFKRAEQTEIHDATERKYLRGLEQEHQHIRLFGFESTAQVSARTLDVFVSLRLTRTSVHATVRDEAALAEEEQGILAPETLLRHAFRKNQLLLLIGDPGSGKTTLL